MTETNARETTYEIVVRGRIDAGGDAGAGWLTTTFTDHARMRELLESLNGLDTRLVSVRPVA